MQTYSKADFEQNIARLAMYTNYDKVWNDTFFQNTFLKKYMWNLPLMAFEVFGIEMTHQQIEIWVNFLKTGGFRGGRLAVPSGHSCSPAGETVMLYNGDIKNVEDVKRRDVLKGRDSRGRIVKELFSGRDIIIKFTLKNGLIKKYTLNHILILEIDKKEIALSVADWICLSEDEKANSYFIKIDKRKKRIKIVNYSDDGYQEYYGFSTTRDKRYLDGDRLLTHNTGKTKTIGLISVHHLLCFRKSITRITAPTLGQITSSSFKEISSSISGMTENRKIGDKVYVPKWGFIAEYIRVNIETVYIKGFQKNWYIEARTAPKGSPENIAGQHQYSYLLILDEASGVNDDTIAVSLGALTEEYNSCIAFSQHTRLSGKFHEWVTTKNIEMGGAWGVVRLSSRYSPRTTITQLKIMLSTYSEDEIRVKVDGLAPKREQGKIFDVSDTEMIFKNFSPIFKEDKAFRQLVVSYDVGYTGYRDSSVAFFAEVFAYQDEQIDKMRKYTKIVKVAKDGTFKKPVDYTTKILFNEILDFLDAKAQDGKVYDIVHILGDASAGGDEAFSKLEEALLSLNMYNFQFKAIRWGSDKLYFEDKKRFINTRAKAFINLRTSISDGTMLIEDASYKPRIVADLLCLSYKFTDRLLYKIISKEELRKQGFTSPDFADAFAQIELANIVPLGADDFTPVNEILETEVVEDEGVLIDMEGKGFSSEQFEEDLKEMDEFGEFGDDEEEDIFSVDVGGTFVSDDFE